MQLWQQILAAIAVGLLWGIGNPLTRQGALQLKRRQQSDPLSTDGRGWLRTMHHIRHTPLLIVPQVRSFASRERCHMLVHRQAQCQLRSRLLHYRSAALAAHALRAVYDSGAWLALMC